VQHSRSILSGHAQFAAELLAQRQKDGRVIRQAIPRQVPPSCIPVRISAQGLNRGNLSIEDGTRRR